jgi:hypothetical protein
MDAMECMWNWVLRRAELRCETPKRNHSNGAHLQPFRGAPPEALILVGWPPYIMEAVAYGRKKVPVATIWDNPAGMSTPRKPRYRAAPSS